MANQAKFDETIFSVGDTVKVYQKIKEAGKTRLQTFQGVVIGIKGREENKTFTVRKVGAGGIGVERIWPLYSPHISKIQVVRKGKVRRAKLYYLRKRVGKRATKVREKVRKVAKVEKVKKKDEEKKSRKSRKKGTPRRGAGRKVSRKKGPKTS